MKLDFGFNSKNIEDGGFTYPYAHENHTPLDRSKLLCTMEDLAKLIDCVNKTDVIESSKKEKMNSKWTFYELTNLTVYAGLLKDAAMECRDAMLPERL